MFGGSGGGGAAVACAFGSLGPVAARGGGAFTDVECVVPAGDPRGSAAGVRIFSQRSVNLPGSPRAPKSGVIGGDFSYTTEGRVEGTLIASDGASDGASIASVLGWGLTPPRGGLVSCVVNGGEPSAALKPLRISMRERVLPTWNRQMPAKFVQPSPAVAVRFRQANTHSVHDGEQEVGRPTGVLREHGGPRVEIEEDGGQQFQQRP